MNLKKSNLIFDIKKYQKYIDAFINKNKPIIFVDLNDNYVNYPINYYGKRAIKYSCDIDTIIKMNKKWKNDYKQQGYIFLKSESIYKEILKLLKNI